MVVTDWAAALNALEINRKAGRYGGGSTVTTYNNVEDAVHRIVDLVDSAGWQATQSTSRIEITRSGGVGHTEALFYRLGAHTWQEFYSHHSD
jgi:hypothetical protein